MITTITVKGRQPPTSTTHVRERVEGRNGERPQTIEKVSAKGGSGNEQRTFRLDPLCQIHIAGKDAGTVGELKVGDHVTIAYKADLGDQFSATDIEAKPGERKAPQEKGHKK